MKPLALPLLLAFALSQGAAWAKLPAPSDEAKAKAADAAAKAAHAGKVASYQLCQSMDRVAAAYVAGAKKAGKEVKPATPTPACADPGPFAAAATSPAPAMAAATAPAAKK